MTISEYAALHRISESTIRRRIKAGTLAAVLVDGRYIISPPPNDQSPASHAEQAEPAVPLVDQMQSEIAHLRDQLTNRDKQIDQLSHLLAMTTQQNGELTRQLPPPRESVLTKLKSLFTSTA